MNTAETHSTLPRPSRTAPAAVFLDRDGVLVEDVHLLTRAEELRILRGVPQALRRLQRAGFRLIVVSNQAVVARGLASEDDVRALHVILQRLLVQAGGPPLDGWYFCPHHPEANVPAYRIDCDCRKPKPGLLLRAAIDHNLNLTASFAVGDRITDIVAGARAGCRTILVQTGKHLDPPIDSTEPLASIRPDYTCADLRAAVAWILE
jgi:D-glycero-D-manno-heptose 1,7-bisphosphate phosphatase